jgi:hypothetical protein
VGKHRRLDTKASEMSNSRFIAADYGPDGLELQPSIATSELSVLLSRALSLEVTNPSTHSAIGDIFSILAFWDGSDCDVDVAHKLIGWIDQVCVCFLPCEKHSSTLVIRCCRISHIIPVCMRGESEGCEPTAADSATFRNLGGFQRKH